MIKFPKGFFEEEEREGFLIEAEMKHVWAAQLQVIKMCEELCKKNNIKYFAIYGTLLGAIRHQGYIPWDDDVDIAMVRYDYERFIEMSTEPYSNYIQILSSISEPEWHQTLARIVNEKKISVSGERLLSFFGCPYIVGSDLFPLDYIPDNKEKRQWVYDIASLIDCILPYSWVDLKEKEFCEKEPEIMSLINKGLDKLEKIFDFEFYREGSLRNQLCCLLDMVSSSYGSNNDKFLTRYPGYVKNRESFYFHRLWVETTVPLKFESTSIMAPIGYDAISYASYGYDYMVPKMGEADHNYPYYKRQREQLKESGLYEFVEDMRKITKTIACDDNIVVDESLEKMDIPEDWKEKIKSEGKKRKVKIYGLNSATILIHKIKVINKLEEKVEDYLSVCKDEIFILVEDLVFEETLYDVLPSVTSRFEKIKKKILDNNGIIADSTNYKYYEICDEYLGDCNSSMFGFINKGIPYQLEKYK